MKRIVIELSAESCTKALAELQKFEREIKPKMEEVCRRLAEIGKQEAIAIIDTIKLDEENAVERVDTVKIDNGYKIVMEGKDVYFIEFGTGSGVSPHFDTSVPVAWGTWSAEHRQMLWKYGFWYYHNVKFEGPTAYMPMYYAEKAMRENLKRVVSEVFSE